MDLATVMGPAGMQLPAPEELQVSEIPADQMVALRALLKKAGKKSLTAADRLKEPWLLMPRSPLKGSTVRDHCFDYMGVGRVWIA